MKPNDLTSYNYNFVHHMVESRLDPTSYRYNHVHTTCCIVFSLPEIFTYIYLQVAASAALSSPTYKQGNKGPQTTNGHYFDLTSYKYSLRPII